MGKASKSKNWHNLFLFNFIQSSRCSERQNSNIDQNTDILATTQISPNNYILPENTVNVSWLIIQWINLNRRAHKISCRKEYFTTE